MTTTSNAAKRAGTGARPAEDGREMCFSQGKPCVYQSETDEDTIITEWPNGVVERLDGSTNMVTRTWPDGTTETFPGDSIQNRTYPHVR